MANVKFAILQKKIDGAIRDLMVKTHVENIVCALDGGPEKLLSTVLAEILTKTDALGNLAVKDAVTYADLAIELKAQLDGKAESGTSLADYGILDAYTKTQIDAMLSGAFTFKGAVDYKNQLPDENNKVGDVWQVRYSGTSGTNVLDAEFAWDGEKWIELGSMFSVDLSGYVPSTRKVNNHALSDDVVLTAADVGAVPTTRTINNKSLSANVELTASDVGAVPTSRTVNGHALSSNVTLTAADVGAARILYGAVPPGDLGEGDLFIQIIN